jgi:hypothetical protein
MPRCEPEASLEARNANWSIPSSLGGFTASHLRMRMVFMGSGLSLREPRNDDAPMSAMRPLGNQVAASRAASAAARARSTRCTDRIESSYRSRVGTASANWLMMSGGVSTAAATKTTTMA